LRLRHVSERPLQADATRCLTVYEMVSRVPREAFPQVHGFPTGETSCAAVNRRAWGSDSVIRHEENRALGLRCGQRQLHYLRDPRPRQTRLAGYLHVVPDDAVPDEALEVVPQDQQQGDLGDARGGR
jgi:hypothetical protein